MHNANRRWLFIALAVAAAVYLISLIAFPEWASSWRLLLVLAATVALGVVALVLALRQLLSPNQPVPPSLGSTTPAIAGNVTGDVVGRDKTTTQTAQRDIVAGNVTNITNQLNLPPAAPQSLHQLPPPPGDFTGREAELNELERAAQAKGITITGLHGLGGIGKTALALKLAERLAGGYPDAQFYVDLQGASAQPLAPSVALARVIHAYHPDAKLPENDAELKALYHSVLHNQRVLLLLDDARDAAQVVPLLPPATCFLLVTSRQHFTLPRLYAKDLDVLPAPDAHQLLLSIAPRLGEHAPTLAALCGYLPLALRTTASALAARPALLIPEFLGRLADARQRLSLTEVDASLTLSYDLLPDPDKARFAHLGVFVADFDRPAAAAVWAMEPPAAQEPLDTLVSFSLLAWDEDTQRFKLHDLVRAFAADHLGPADRAARLGYASHYRDVARAADSLYLRGGGAVLQGLQLFDREWPHIQAGQAWAAALAETDEAAARLAEDFPDAGVYCLDVRLHPRERIAWRETALAAARRLGLRPSEGVHLGNLGNCYAELGEPRRAIEFYEQRLQIAREIGDRRGEGSALGSLGNAYADVGEPRRAIEFYEQHLPIAREIGDRRGEGNALGNLGSAYADVGEPRRAIEFYEQHLQIAREIGDRRGEAITSWNLGLRCEEQDDLAQAIAAMEICVTYEREVGHQDAEPDAAHVEALRARLAAGPKS